MFSSQKAEALNKQFLLRKTWPTFLPECYGHPYPKMSNISFSSDGIQTLLDDLDTNKATGPDSLK